MCIRDSSNRARVEAARGYLETILAHLSSGVMALNQRGELRTYNEAAANILDVALAPYVGFTLERIIEKQPRLANFFQGIALDLQQDAVEISKQGESLKQGGVKNSHGNLHQKDEIKTQIELLNAQGKQILTMRGTRLPDGGYVVAVSYTHLDVYKRQCYASATRGGAGFKLWHVTFLWAD